MAYLNYQATDAGTEISHPTNESGVGGTAGSTKKRPITVESQESEPRKRRALRTAHERRLTGDYETPADAQPIRILQRVDEGRDSRPSARPMAVKPGSRSHRPMNTLNSSPHAAIHQRSTANRVSKGYRRPGESNERRILVPPVASLNGDGFVGSERRIGIRANENPAKKRKLDVSASRTDQSTEPIDLTNDVFKTEIVARNGKPLPKSSQESLNRSFVSEPAGPLFKNTEYHRTNGLTNIEKEKPRRKSKEGQGSSQGSSRGTPADLASVHPTKRPKSSNHAVIHVEDDEASSRNLQNSAKRRQVDEGKHKLPINLTKGFSDIKPRAKKSKSEDEKDEIKNAVNVLEAGERRQHGTESDAQQGRKGAPHRKRREILQDNDGNFYSYLHSKQPTGSPSPRLAPSFCRDESHTPPLKPAQKLKASARMKATSKPVPAKVSPIRTSFGSGDELAGGNTIGSQMSGSASPQKKSATQSHLRNGKIEKSRKRSSSPSDLPATQFKASGRWIDVPGRRAEDPHAEKDRVKLRAFFATSCVLTSGDIELRYDEPNNQIELYFNDEIQYIPGKTCALCLGDAESRQFYSNRESNKVYLKGANNDISNGHICIAFRDLDDVGWFLNTLLHVTDKRLKIVDKDSQWLDNVFSKQCQEIEQKARQEQLRREATLLAEQNPRTRRFMDRDEEIKYETDDSHASKFIKHIQSNNNNNNNNNKHSEPSPRLTKEADWFASSKYFTNPDVRRSTRLPSLMKPPSPTPPPPVRWTHEHPLTRWTHSVVYPPEGLRRVTVDFQDLERLDEGEFLNDNIIGFALRNIEENMAPEHKDSVLFFNSFFYSSLTTKNGRKAFNYDGVKRWTKNKDLLTFPYVVVPININLHWFVAIICNLPSLSRRAAGLDDNGDEEQKGGTSGEASPNVISEATPASWKPRLEDLKNVTEQTEAMNQLSLSSEEGRSKAIDLEGGETDQVHEAVKFVDDEAPASGSKPTSASKKSKKRPPPALKKYDPDSPTIITLDSFGSSHALETRNLKDYLAAEAESKRSMALDTKQVQGMTAKGIPEQTNFCDCGLYLVGYVEQFAKDPRKFVTKVLTRQLDKEEDFASFDSSAKRAEIRDELIKLHDLQEAERKEKKSAKKTPAKGKGDVPAAAPPSVPTQTQRSKETKEERFKGAKEELDQALSKPLPKAAASDLRETAPAHATLSNDGQGDAELELSVPRPFTASTQDRAVEDASRASKSRHDSTDHEDEMLDNSTDEGGGSLIAWINGSAPLLDNLDAELQNGPPGGHHDGPSRVLEETDRAIVQRLSPGVRHTAPTSENGRDEVIDLEADNLAEAEIPDSQEKQPTLPHPTWTGTHTRFDE